MLSGLSVLSVLGLSLFSVLWYVFRFDTKVSVFMSLSLFVSWGSMFIWNMGYSSSGLILLGSQSKFWSGCSSVVLFDFYSLSFMLLSYHVTWTILLYANWYMGKETNKLSFKLTLVVFLFLMFLLVFCSDLIFLLISWESVGILSFLLISWWSGRSEASVSAKQAVMYNRASDFSLYVSIFMLVISGTNAEMSITSMPFYVGVAISVAMVAKSSQIMFHPWLPSAMESPTPVSSLLHSSTMVVASVFFLIRVSGLLSPNMMNSVVFLGAMTMLLSAWGSLSQMDFKKIVAFSTTSQLGFMMVVVACSMPELSFIHMSLHAYFKSLSFLTSSYFIHAESSSQDFRFMGRSTMESKFSLIMFILSVLSLSGFPFFASFYSKDLILENLGGSVMNRFCFILLVISSMFTVSYSFRLIEGLNSSMSSVVWVGKRMSIEKLSVNVSWSLGRLSFMVVLSSLTVDTIFNMIEEEYMMGISLMAIMIVISGVVVSVGGGSTSVFSLYTLFQNPLMHRKASYLMNHLLSISWMLEYSVLDYTIKCSVSQIKGLSTFVKRTSHMKSYLIMLVFYMWFLLMLNSFF